jgi:hypothetical protein
MIKTFVEFVNEAEELEEFFDDLEDSEKKLKLISKFKSDIKDTQIKTSFDMGKPIKKFKPKITIMTKKKDKGIF